MPFPSSATIPLGVSSYAGGGGGGLTGAQATRLALGKVIPRTAVTDLAAAQAAHGNPTPPDWFEVELTADGGGTLAINAGTGFVYASSSGGSIYSADGVLLANRTIDGNGNQILFTNNASAQIDTAAGGSLLLNSNATLDGDTAVLAGSTTAQVVNTEAGGNVGDLTAGAGFTRLQYQDGALRRSMLANADGLGLLFTAADDFQIDSNPGTPGQVFQSNGPDLPPTWGTVAASQTVVPVAAAATVAVASFDVASLEAGGTVQLPAEGVVRVVDATGLWGTTGTTLANAQAGDTIGVGQVVTPGQTFEFDETISGEVVLVKEAGSTNWRVHFDTADNSGLANQGGPTANRPATPILYEQYFDTDVGFEVAWNGTDWVSGTGAIA